METTKGKRTVQSENKVSGPAEKLIFRCTVNYLAVCVSLSIAFRCQLMLRSEALSAYVNCI